MGAGESGTGAAILGVQKDYDVFVSDSGAIKENYIDELNHYHIAFEQSMHTEALILNADLVIKSPGIPEKAEIIKKLKALEIAVISEIEFAGKYTNAYTICITGTDGKTTTASMIYDIMKRADMNVGLGGNIGKSFARQVALENFDYYVLEISSFQLDGMYDFRANIAVLTNISPDHLDRYNYELDNYISSKFRIVQNQTLADYFIYCADNKLTLDNLEKHQTKAKLLPFSFFDKCIPGAYNNENQLTVEINPLNNQITIMNLSELSLKGRHNVYNSMAAAVVGEVLEIRKGVIRESLSQFVNIEHRLENCGKVGGIEFVNDSKATTVNAVWYALESMQSPVVWIAGGVDKGNDYTQLKQLVKDKVKIIVCLGLDNRKIHEAFGQEVDMIVNATSMQEAVHIAYKLASKEDIVLLSPACASFDLFEDYQDRGRQFKKAVRNL